MNAAQYEVFILEREMPESDAEKIAILRGMTNANMPADQVRIFFRRNHLWSRTMDGGMEGPINDALESDQVPDLVKAGIRELWSALYTDSETELHTHDSNDVARDIRAALDVLMAFNFISQDEIDEFYAIGLDLLFPDMDVETLDSARVLYETNETDVERRNGLEALRARIENDFIIPAMDTSDDADVVIAKIKEEL